MAHSSNFNKLTFVLICHKIFCAPRTLRPRAPAPGGGTCPPLCHRWLRHWSIYVKLGRFSPVVRKIFFFWENNKSVISYLRTLTTWHCPHSPANGQRSIDISCPRPTAANLQQRVCCCSCRFAAVCPCWDRRTPYRSTDPAVHTLRAAVPLNEKEQICQ